MSKPVLKLDWCSHAAAKYACEKWHYTRRVPRPPLVNVGVWEDGCFVGCVMFARGACMNAGKPYSLDMTEVAELVRVALRKHKVPVSRIVSIAVKMLRRLTPSLRLLFSYADLSQGHHGGIYQACGWIYVGLSQPTGGWEYKVKGEWLTTRTLGTNGSRSEAALAARFPGAERRRQPRKHKYLMPLDPEMRARILPLSKPYPKRAAGVDGDTPANHAGEGGSSPTAALSNSEGR